MARFVAYLVVCYVVVIIVLLAMEDQLLFHPVPASKRWIDLPADSDCQDVFLRTTSGIAIHGRWWPCKGATGAVLFCHSRSGNLSLALTPAAVGEWHRELGKSVFIFDYPGYGRSEGSPSEAGCYAAADAAYNWLIEDQGVSPQNILIVGRSLGTAVAIDLGCRKRHCALVLISPPTSLPDSAQWHYPFLPARWLVRNRFDSLAKIGECTEPILIIHGTRDRTVPLAQGERLYAAAHDPKRFVAVEGADHSDAVLVDFFPTLRRFLGDALPESDPVLGENPIAKSFRGP